MSSIQILLLDKSEPVRIALSRVSLGRHIELLTGDPDNPAEWQSHNFAAIIGDESLFFSGRDEPLIESIKRQHQCPIIFLSLSSSRGLATMARDAGVAAVLTKPFGAAKFRQVLGSVLQRDISADELRADGSDSTYDSSNNGRHQEMISSVAEHVAPDSVFDELFQEIERRQPLQDGLDAFDVVEKQLIRRVLEKCDGNQSQAARFLGITRNTLRKRIQKYGFSSLIARDGTSDQES